MGTIAFRSLIEGSTTAVTDSKKFLAVFVLLFALGTEKACGCDLLAGCYQVFRHSSFLARSCGHACRSLELHFSFSERSSSRAQSLAPGSSSCLSPFALGELYEAMRVLVRSLKLAFCL